MEGHHAEGHQNKAVETSTDRGMFDFIKKKDKDEDVTMADANLKPAKEEEKPSLMDKLHRSNSSSSSSSDEEEIIGEDGEKRKKKKEKKKGLKDKIKEKISGDHKEATEHNGSAIPTENPEPEEKKGFLDKIKEKLPGHGQPKKAEDDGHPAHDAEPKEKGILEKIKEKIPGCHGHKAEEDNKPKET